MESSLVSTGSNGFLFKLTLKFPVLTRRIFFGGKVEENKSIISKLPIIRLKFGEYIAVITTVFCCISMIIAKNYFAAFWSGMTVCLILIANVERTISEDLMQLVNELITKLEESGAIKRREK